MRYLNKIIFINSADKSIKYAEVNLDGNVHLIGTQGVGKSTLLRAVLFFYNADKIKLGIAKEKKTFDEYYFPYQNSYIIYEVQTENGLFCVLAFKSQGRVAFRFFNSAFDKNHFIDNEGRAFETWEKTREAFGKYIFYTKIIHSYEEYRNILYGNNKGLSNEFRKYAILESKQFQNIPRTITNVFLNTNLSAEFVKETIIKSLNEEDIKIDLTTYSHNHLKDFEPNLNDIKRWTDRNKNGENLVEKQAENVSKLYSRLKYLEKNETELAYQLGWAFNKAKDQQPKLKEKLEAVEVKRAKVNAKLKELDGVFEKKKEKSQEQIGLFKGKLDEIKTKRVEYDVLKVDTILERVSKKGLLELEKKNLTKENEILTSNFLEIKQRYDALLSQLTNQLKEFENSKQSEINNAKETLFQTKEKLTREYELLFEEIRKQHKAELELANSLVKEKTEAIIKLKIKQSEVKNKRFYDTEIEAYKLEIAPLTASIVKAENDIQQVPEKNKNIQKEWELEESSLKAIHARDIEKQNDLQKNYQDSILAINNKIDNNKDSLYGWLNEQIPDWDKTIGKVIDEENVLFKSDLNPQKISNGELSFYGISIDTSEISKEVKTIADYERDKEELNNRIQFVLQSIADFDSQLIENIEKLRKRFTPKIKVLKEDVQNNEYKRDQNKLKLEEKKIQLSDLKIKAETEKKEALDKIGDDISKYSEEEIKAIEEVSKIESNINKSLDNKKKEKDSKLKSEQQNLSDVINRIDLEVQIYKNEIEQKEVNIKDQQKQELENKGVNTTQLEVIENRIIQITDEFKFIEQNNSLVERYKYDKEQLFEKEDEFKFKKTQFENKLDSDNTKHKQQQLKYLQEIEQLKNEIGAIKISIQKIEDDLTAFERFKKTDVFYSLENYINDFNNENKTDDRCDAIIDEINITERDINKRYIELQEAINKFTGNFNENNIFSFKTKFNERYDYIEFAELLKEFIEEDKISEYKKRVEERFAHIIRQIGKETGDLESKEGEIHGVISEINKDFVARKFVQAIKSMELRTVTSANKIFQLLVEIRKFNDENTFNLGTPNLFSQEGQTSKNEKAISLLKQLIKEMATYKEKEITLSDSFELQFRIVENDNDTDWVEKLSNVGSDGTDVLVKAMINIMLLNVFKERAAKKHKDDFRLHCMMDEIGKLHPNNVKGILKFANDRNILLINSSPTSYNATDYRYTYLLAKDNKNVTSIKRLVRKIPTIENQF